MAPGPGARTTVRLAEIAAALGAELRGDGSREIARIGALEGATPQTISFLAQARLRHLLVGTQATCVIVREDSAAEVLAQGAAALVTADPYLCYARLTRWWAQRHRAAPVAGIHASAVIAEGARIHPTASIGPLVVVEPGARIGAGAIVGAQCFIGDGAVVSEGARLHVRATLGAACVLGRRSVLHGGSVIGSDGFGFAPTEGRWEKIEQLGAVSIGDDVEIGANTCVDRGALDDTVIEEGVKLDNLIQIAHNVRIGAHTAMAGCVGVAGSARIGRHCTFGGAAMILGHLEIADHVHISAASVVMSSILRPGQYSGVFPIDDNASWEKNAATLRQLHTLRARLRALEKKSST